MCDRLWSMYCPVTSRSKAIKWLYYFSPSLCLFSTRILFFSAWYNIHSWTVKIRRKKSQAKWWWRRRRRRQRQWSTTVKRCKQRNHRQWWFDTIEWISHWKRSHSMNNMECKWIYNSYSINVVFFFIFEFYCRAKKSNSIITALLMKR